MNIHDLYNIARFRRDFPKEQIHLAKIIESHTAMRNYLTNTKPIEGLLYGVDTCFGPHALNGGLDRIELQYNLVNHLTVITDSSKDNEWLDREEVRSVLAARILVLCKGYSGVSLELISKLIEFLDNDKLPSIPVRGSLGASGDLIPLSYIAKHLQEHGWEWKEKEAIAITNGTSSMTGLLAFQIVQFSNLLKIIEDLLKVQLHLTPIFSDAFHPTIAECRRSGIIQEFILRVRPFIHSKTKSIGTPIQDSYIIRSIPIIWGTVLEKIYQLTIDMNEEINTVSDNPVYSFEDKRFIEGALFYGSTVSLMADDLNLTIVTLANWIERTIQYLLDNKENGDVYPLMLSPIPGRFAGMAGLGLYATHLIAEMRRDSHPGSIQSIPGNGGNQNIVPMGSLSVIRNRRTLLDLRSLTGIYFNILLQADSLKNPISHNSNDSMKLAYPSIFVEGKEFWQPLINDRSLGNDQEKIQRLIEKYL